MISGSAPREEEVHDEEYEIHEGTKLYRPEVASALRVFTGMEVEIKANDDQVRDVVGTDIRKESCHGDYSQMVAISYQMGRYSSL